LSAAALYRADAGLLWRLPLYAGIVDVDIHLLWHREQR